MFELIINPPKIKIMKLKLHSFCIAITLLSVINTNVKAFELLKESNKTLLKSKVVTAPAMPKKPINIKINLMALALNNISVFGEFAFHKNMSGQLGFRYMIPLNLTKKLSSVIPDSLGITAKMSGYAITPEFRFYPGKHEENAAPHGFYLGLYGRYSKLNIDFTKEFNGSYGRKTVDFKLGLTQMSAGFILGAQGAKKGVTIDWWIMAAGIGVAQMKGTAKDPIFAYPEITKDLEGLNFKKDIGGVKIDAVTVLNNAAETVSVKVTLPGFNVRSLIFGGLCLGYHF